jgi:hypothetical protein
MRTTLDIDIDVLQAAKELASAQNTTAGAVISELFREALTLKTKSGESVVRNGFPQFAAAGPLITEEMIEGLLDKDY